MGFFFFFTGIDLENIVYYKDNTHYFVMTAKKQSLLDKGVILNVSSLLLFLCVLMFFHEGHIGESQVTLDRHVRVCY